MALATFIHLFIQSNLEINCRFTSDQWKLNIWGLKFNHQVTKNGRFWHEFIELVELLIGKWDFLFLALGRWRIEIQNVHSFVPLLGGNVQLFFVTSKGRCWITNRFSRLRFTGNTMRRRIATNRYDPPNNYDNFMQNNGATLNQIFPHKSRFKFRQIFKEIFNKSSTAT